MVYCTQLPFPLHSGFGESGVGNIHSLNGLLLLLYVLGRFNREELHTTHTLGLLRCGLICLVSKKHLADAVWHGNPSLCLHADALRLPSRQDRNEVRSRLGSCRRVGLLVEARRYSDSSRMLPCKVGPYRDQEAAQPQTHLLLCLERDLGCLGNRSMGDVLLEHNWLSVARYVLRKNPFTNLN
jgi:hypothetical protein